MNKLMRLCYCMTVVIAIGSPSITNAQDFGSGEYDKALWMTTRFYGAQRSGNNNWLLYNHLPSGVPAGYRGTAHIDDSDGAYDLSGGWHDCGDHVKFGQTQFYSAYMLLKSYKEFKQGYEDYYSYDYVGYTSSGNYTWEGGNGTPNGIPDILDEVKHATDFFIKCAKNDTEFYYQVGNGGSGGTGGDHTHRVTATLSQTLANNEGGQDRPIGKNPNGAAMASFCAATLALMSEQYRPFDEAYADLCLVHANYAYAYAAANPGATGTAFGGFYGANDNWKNAWAIANAEMYWATGTNSYRSTALALTAGNGSFDVTPNQFYTYDYSNNGELALYVLAQLGHPNALSAFNTRITGHWLSGGNYNGEGIYSSGGGWGKLRYVGNAAYLIALYNKINSTSLDIKVFDNVDYIMGSNSSNRSFISGYGTNSPQQPHHRNVYLDDSYANNSAVLTIPTKNQQFGALVGGQLNPSTYSDVWDQYVNTEVCIDYNAGLVGGLAAIKAQVAPVDTNKFLSTCSTPDLGSDQSLCGVGSVTLNTGVTPNGTITFEWFKDNVSQGAPSTSQNSRVVSSGGTWKVEIDSVGECQRTDQVVISSTLPTVDLGPDVDLCDPSSVILDAGASGGGVNFAWTKDASATGGNTQTLLVTEAGNYGVTISASGCSDESDYINITSSLPTPIHDTICASGNTNPAVSGAGNYDWYDASSGGTFLGNGNSITQSISSNTPFYVEDNSSFSTSVGPSSVTGGTNQWGVATGLHLHFSLTTDFTINSLKIPFEIYGNTTSSIEVEVLDNSGNPLSPARTFTSDPTSITTAQNGQLIQFNFSGFDIQQSWGTDLRLRLTSKGSINGNPHWTTSGGAYPYNTTPSGLVTITGESGGEGDNNDYHYFHDWDISSGTSCQRATVYGVIDPGNPNCSGGCDDPGTATLSPSGPVTQCAGNVTLTASESGTGTFEYEFFRGASSVQGPGSSNTYNATISGSYIVVITDPSDPGTCSSTSNAVNITIDQTPTTSIAGSNQTVCATTATLSGNNPSIGTGMWTVLSGGATISTPSNRNSGVTNLSVGANVFRWTISNGSCAASTSDVTITRDENPTSANAGSPQSVCATSATLASNTPSVGTGAWTTISGGASVTSPTNPSSSVSALSVGANVFRWTISNGSCTSTTDEVTITRSGSITTANAGSNQNICATSTTLSGNTVSGGETGTWTVISGTGTIADPNNPSTSVSGLSVGLNVLRWTIDNGVCTPSTDDVNINVDEAPSASSAGPNQTICGDNTTLAANTPSVGIGTWSIVSGSANISSPNDPSSGLTSISSTTTLSWTISNGVCSDEVDQVVITPSTAITTANAGSNQNVCTTSTTLSGNTVSGGETGTWTVISGTGTFADPNNPSTSVSGLSVGLNVLRWTIDNGVCTPSTDDVNINVDEAPSTSSAGPNQTICGDNTTLAANTPSVGIGTWSIVSGSANISSPNDPNSNLTSISSTTTLSWTISNGVCSDEVDQVVITPSPAVTTANAGPDQNICATTATLGANTPGAGETGTWSVISGSASFGDANSESSSISGLSNGTNVLQWTIDNGVCPISTDQININVDEAPSTASTGTDQVICSSSSTLSANTPSIGTGTWTLVSGTGNVVDPSNPNSVINSLGVGINIFRWTISNGVCTSETDDLQISVDEMPTTANAGTDQTICDDNAVMAANTPSVGTGTWTIITGSPTITNPNDPNTTITNISLGTVTLQWEITNGVCTVSNDNVDITRTGSSAADVSVSPSTVNICAGDNQTFTAIPVNGGGTPTYEWFVNGGSVQNGPTNTYNYAPNTSDEVYVIMTSSLGCATGSPATSTSVFPNVDQTPTPSSAGSDISVCTDNATMSANTPTVGSGTWTLASGSASITSSSDPSTAITSLVSGATATFNWTISNGACPSSVDAVSITRDAMPSSASAGPDDSYCMPSYTLQGNTPTTGIGMWTVVTGSASLGTPSDPNSTVTIPAGQSATLRWSISNGTCTASSDDVTITNTCSSCSNPGTATLSPLGPITQCGGTVLLTASESGTGTFEYAFYLDGLLIQAASSTNTYNATISGNYHVVVTDPSDPGTCFSTSNIVSITIDQNPDAANAGTDQAICTNSATLSANTPVSGTGTWSVISGSGTVTSPTDPTSSVTGLSVGTNILQWTISNGSCPDATDQVTIDVTGSVSASVSISEDMNSVCSGTNVTFTATPTNGGATPTYQWKLNSTNVGTNSATFNSSTLSNGDIVEVEMTSSLTCVSNSPASSNSINMTINSAPSTTSTITGNTTVCSSAIGEGYGASTVSGATNYSWSVPTGASITSGDGTQSIVVDFGTTSGNITVTPSNGCGNGTPTNLAISVSPCGPTPDFTASNTSICEDNQTVTYTNASVGTSGTETYSWNFGADANPATATGSGPHTISYQNPGNKDISLTINAGGTNYNETKIAYVNVKARPVTSDISGPTSVNCNATESYSIINTSGSIYNWNVPGPGTPSSTNTVSVDFTGIVNGYRTISVIEQSSNGCLGSTKVLAVSVCLTPVTDPVAGIEINAYPNPTSDKINLSVDAPSVEEMVITIVDLHGVQVREYEYSTDENIRLGGDLASGIYIIKVQIGTKFYTLRFVKI